LAVAIWRRLHFAFALNKSTITNGTTAYLIKLALDPNNCGELLIHFNRPTHALLRRKNAIIEQQIAEKPPASEA